MKTTPERPQKTQFNSPLSGVELLAVVGELQQQLALKDSALHSQNTTIDSQIDTIESQHGTIESQNGTIESQSGTIESQSSIIKQYERYIALLEEQLRLKKAQQFAASSEKSVYQLQLFDEAEMEVELEALHAQLPDELTATALPPSEKKRQRGFSASLVRERIELTLTEEEKAGASKTFFTKVKEELAFIPAQLKVIEYWQEKAVFEQAHGEFILAAKRPVHPLGKCFATPALLAYIITAKYADGLPLYRLEKMMTRYGHDVGRTNMANWIIRLNEVFKPLITLLREVQNDGLYIQADESRIQVLKEDGKTAQSNKWMWVSCGGPPEKPSVLFEYDPSRAGKVAVRLLDGFTGILQADGYSGYGRVCKENKLTRIGCWDHARRKFMDAIKAVPAGKGAHKKKATKADVALSYINKLYLIERGIKDRNDGDKYHTRQTVSLPLLNEFKGWLEKNVNRVMKDSLTRKAMEYTLNQWPSLIGYCEKGYLNISNARAENAIRPFAVGRKAWLFADSSQGARASATCYSLIETAKANQLEPSAYILYVLEHIAEADTLEKLEALLPWNVPLAPVSKNVPQYG